MKQLLKTIYYEVKARLGFWIPCDKYMPNPKYWDFVIISFYEPGLTYRYVPMIAEYSHTYKKWHGVLDDDVSNWNLNNIYKVTHWHKIPNDDHLKVEPKSKQEAR